MGATFELDGSKFCRSKNPTFENAMRPLVALGRVVVVDVRAEDLER